ncbi:unnamed protein product [Linum tenue]|uniref:Uncharacterized protein n=1 Tax=Linum tenue TaxID=586396 RepID=A0AAV0PIP3_9ROSI|nr:unnamed protein product [Linum tenue]
MELARRYRRVGDLGSVRRLQIQLRHRRGVDRHGGRHFPLPLRPPRQAFPEGRAGSDGQAIHEGGESGGGGQIDGYAPNSDVVKCWGQWVDD